MYCKNCGKEITEGQKFCTGCGAEQAAPAQPAGQAVQPQLQPVCQQPRQAYRQPQQGYQQPQATPNSLLGPLSSKIKVEAFVWIGIAALQVLIGLYNIMVGIALNDSYFEDGTVNIITGIFVLLVAALNFFNSYKSLQYSKAVFQNPVGIVAKYEPVGALVGTLVYNLIFGGVVGAVGSIFGFVTRSFVMNNKQGFLAIEAEFTTNTPS